jgi:hypothetical protein
MTRLSRTCGTLLLACAAITHAQTPTTSPTRIIIRDGAPVAISPGAPTATPTTQPATPATTQPATPEQKRLATLLAVRFDRKPPAILTALAPKPPATQPATKPTTQPTTQALAEAANAADAQQLKSDVESGHWPGVKKLIATFPKEDAKKLHANIVQQLLQDPQSVLLPDDVLDLAEALPADFEEKDIPPLGQLLARALARNNATDPLIARLEPGTPRFGGKDPANRARAAALLYAATRVVEAAPFLPPLDPALKSRDIKTIDLYAYYFQVLGRERRDKNPEAALRKSWDLAQLILKEAPADAKERDWAFQRCLELMPLLPKELGNAFLNDTFKSRPAEGFKLLTNLANQVAQSAPVPGRPAQPDYGPRLQNMQLQKRLADAILAANPAPELRTPLNLMILSWLAESDWTKQRYQQQRNTYSSGYRRIYTSQGIIYENDDSPMMQQRMNPNEPQPIPPQQLLETAPSDAWLATLDKSLEPRIRGALAELHLKNDDVDKALPLIEAVAPAHPRLAQSLAAEFLRTWGRVKNPNTGMSYDPDMPYYYSSMYGSSMGGISLTRLAQERNLKELSAILTRLQKLNLPVGGLDDSAVVSAFSSAHSRAEVYRLDDIQLVFGPTNTIPGKTFTQLIQDMRQRLAREWRQPQIQQQAKTKRTDKDIDAEVARGYQLMVNLLDQRAAATPVGPASVDGTNWRTPMLRGMVLFDWAEFEYGKKVPLAVYTKKRDEAFDSFQKSLDLYAKAVPALEEKDQTAQPFQQYFNACLGASDLQYLTRQDEPNKVHTDRIRSALLALPEPARERHLAQFGKGLSDNLPTVPAELKARYLRVGVQIVGDHPAADEARKIAQYYQDLLGEVELHLALDMKDNDSAVGHSRPFGAFLALRHTNAIGRESGGFNRYLTNQSSGRYSYYVSYGPSGPRNYRDDLEKKIRQALVEHFDILSITFHDEKVEPRGYGRPDWRETPLAYILLRAKDPRTDRIPPVQMTLEFTDKRGQVNLPIESNIVLIDARPDDTPPRPLDQLKVTQILDARDANKGKLTLEIKAAGNGLLPELKELLDPEIPGLKIEKINEQPAVITKLDTEGDKVAAASERPWMINYAIDERAAGSPTFRFPALRLTGDATYKRYADADLEDVKPQLALAGVRLRPTKWWKWPAAIAAALVVLIAAAWLTLRAAKKRRATRKPPTYTMPHTITPFTVMDLLRRIHGDQAIGLSTPLREQLLTDIKTIEQEYFARREATSEGNGNGDRATTANPSDLAQRWLARVH